MVHLLSYLDQVKGYNVKMLFDTNKQKGKSGLAVAIAYYGTNGYTVSLPLNDTQDYDLIVDDGETLKKVQVKSTSSRTKRGYSYVSLRNTGGTKGTVYGRVVDSDIDILFIVTEKLELYEIPKSELYDLSSITLIPERQKFRVDSIPTVYEREERALKDDTRRKKTGICSVCGKPIYKSSLTGKCDICYKLSTRKVDRPSKEILLSEILENPMTQVAQRYGVSDNTIRKWCRQYGLPTKSHEIKSLKLQ